MQQENEEKFVPIDGVSIVYSSLKAALSNYLLSFTSFMARSPLSGICKLLFSVFLLYATLPLSRQGDRCIPFVDPKKRTPCPGLAYMLMLARRMQLIVDGRRVELVNDGEKPRPRKEI